MHPTPLLLTASLLLTGPVQSDAPECRLSGVLPAQAPRFTDYPASPMWSGTPATPVLTTRLAKLFRTQLSTQSRDKPNFAGHYHIATWGCGSSCINWGLTDAISGQAVMGERYGNVDWGNVDADQPLLYRPDSRLLILMGAPNETPVREGYTYLLWTGKSFRQLAFYPATQACIPAEPNRALKTWP